MIYTEILAALDDEYNKQADRLVRSRMNTKQFFTTKTEMAAAARIAALDAEARTIENNSY